MGFLGGYFNREVKAFCIWDGESIYFIGIEYPYTTTEVFQYEQLSKLFSVSPMYV